MNGQAHIWNVCLNRTKDQDAVWGVDITVVLVPPEMKAITILTLSLLAVVSASAQTSENSKAKTKRLCTESTEVY
jgi:hypothetical protein